MVISCSGCRRRVREGMPVWYLVSDGVVQYISKHGLYRADQDWTAAHPSCAAMESWTAGSLPRDYNPGP